jgi:membrane carboxypeptidase/penicillin-binding protein PbpC
VDGAEFVLTGQSQGDRIALRPAAGAQGTLHWYLNDRYLGASSGESPLLLNLSPGAHRVSCMSSEGHTHSVAFTVHHPERLTRLRESL